MGRGAAGVWEGIPDIPRAGGRSAWSRDGQTAERTSPDQVGGSGGGLDPHLRPAPPPAPWNVIFPLITRRPGKRGWHPSASERWL